MGALVRWPDDCAVLYLISIRSDSSKDYLTGFTYVSYLDCQWMLNANDTDLPFWITKFQHGKNWEKDIAAELEDFDYDVSQ